MSSRIEYDEFLRGLENEPPIECQFEVGDKVTYTNEYGVSFPGYQIVGFAKDDDFYGRFIYLDNSSWWFPVKPSELTLESMNS